MPINRPIRPLTTAEIDRLRDEPRGPVVNPTAAGITRIFNTLDELRRRRGDQDTIDVLQNGLTEGVTLTATAGNPVPMEAVFDTAPVEHAIPEPPHNGNRVLVSLPPRRNDPRPPEVIFAAGDTPL